MKNFKRWITGLSLCLGIFTASVSSADILPHKRLPTRYDRWTSTIADALASSRPLVRAWGSRHYVAASPLTKLIVAKKLNTNTGPLPPMGR